MPQLEATEPATGRPPCYSPDRPIPPRDRRRIHPVRLHRRLDRNLLIWIPLSKKSRASLKAESIIRPVFALLQGSKSLRLTGSGKTYGMDGTPDCRYGSGLNSWPSSIVSIRPSQYSTITAELSDIHSNAAR